MHKSSSSSQNISQYSSFWKQSFNKDFLVGQLPNSVTLLALRTWRILTICLENDEMFLVSDETNFIFAN